MDFVKLLHAIDADLSRMFADQFEVRLSLLSVASLSHSSPTIPRSPRGVDEKKVFLFFCSSNLLTRLSQVLAHVDAHARTPQLTKESLNPNATVQMIVTEQQLTAVWQSFEKQIEASRRAPPVHAASSFFVVGIDLESKPSFLGSRNTPALLQVFLFLFQTLCCLCPSKPFCLSYSELSNRFLLTPPADRVKDRSCIV